MPRTTLDALLQHVRRLAVVTTGRELTDSQLLQRFVSVGDGDAFTTLLRRHAGLVWGVCRRLLGHEQDAEDAFQATFLVLARQAASIRGGQTVPNWLYRVASRTALRAHRDRARRQERERAASAMPQSTHAGDLALRELQAVLAEEIERLPERHRAPFILCCLEGKSKAEAATELGWREGTLSGRLARARQQLRQRLASRGFVLSAVLGTVALSRNDGWSLPVLLAERTVAAAFDYGSRKTVAAAVCSAEVVALANRITKALLMAKTQTALAFLFLAVCILTGTGLLAYAGRQGPDRELASASGRRIEPEAGRPARTDRYGDPLPPGALARMGTVRFRHGDVVEGIALSPDGRTVAAGSRDKTLRLWDVATGQELRRLPDHQGPLRFVAFSPDGTILASGGRSVGTIDLCDAATGKALRRLESNCWLGHVAFSPDGKSVAGAANRHCMLLWEAATGRLLQQLDGREECNFAVAFAFSPDGRMLATGGEGEKLRLWNLATGVEERHFQVQPIWSKEKSGPPHYHGLVQAVAFSQDGRILASAAKNSPVRLWDVASGQEIRSLQGDRWGAFSLAFSHDGSMLASGDALGMVRVWEPATGKEVRRFQAHPDWVSGLIFARDGQTLVTSGDATIGVWDVRTATPLLPDRGHLGRVTSTVLLPDGRTLLTGSADNTIRQWDLTTGIELRRSAAEPTSDRGIVFSPDGRFAACNTKKPAGENTVDVGIQLWDLAGQKKLALLWHPNLFYARFSPDNKTLYTQVWDVKERAGLLLSWDVATGKELRVLARKPSGLGAIELSADGKVLSAVAEGQETTIHCLDAATGKELCQAKGERLLNQALAISPDNQLLAVGDGPPFWANSGDFQHFIHVWDIASGKEVRRFGRSDKGYWPLVFSRDGRTLVTAGEDNQIRLWEVASGGERLRMAGHQGRVQSFLFAENGKTLISTSADTTALVWDLTGLRAQVRAADSKGTVKNLQDLWNALADDAAPAYRALWSLTATPKEAVAFLQERLRPAAPPNESAIAKLVLDLDSPRFATRQRAAAELAKLEHLAESALRKALTNRPSQEMQRRIEQLLEQLEAVPSGDQLRPIRAIEALEHIGLPLAGPFLQELAGGEPNARLTRAAAASLRRLAGPPVSTP